MKMWIYGVGASLYRKVEGEMSKNNSNGPIRLAKIYPLSSVQWTRSHLHRNILFGSSN